MPNWCTNSVTFSGGDISGLKNLLEQGVKYNDETGNGWLPDFLKDDGVLYLFEINLTMGADGNLYMNCDTKWTSSIDELIAIANKFGCNFVNCYEESGMGIYGEYIYEQESGGVSYELTDEEVNMVEYDEDADLYRYKGKESTCSYDFYEEMLDEKKKGK